MYRLKLTRRAKRELKKLKSSYLESISEIFDEILDDPFIGKPLFRELTGRFSYKMGDYRIIYKIDHKNKIILIITAGHRSVVYE